ncbi:MAG: HTTM domain-containing protein [Schleiferiaceae bacterium]|nr:HTTM domain-containing protein [Schleiferiaceae bacterium]
MLSNKNYAIEYYSIALKALALFHMLEIFGWRYYTHDPEYYFKLPVFSFMEGTPPILHYLLFLVYLFSSIFFILKRKNYLYSFGIAFGLLYLEFHDKFCFHQDIFLAINIFFLYGFINYAYTSSKPQPYLLKSSIFMLKIVVSLVYFLAGITKLNPYFFSGLLLTDMLATGPLGFLFSAEQLSVLSSPLLILTTVLELLVPFLIWSRYKTFAVVAAVLMHFGISIIGERGILFNLYLPITFILLYSYAPFKWNTSKKWLYKLARFVDTQKLGTITLDKSTSFTWKSYLELSRNLIWLHPLTLLSFLVYSRWVAYVFLLTIYRILDLIRGLSA